MNGSAFRFLTISAPALYEGPARRLIQRLKYEDQPHVAVPMAQLMQRVANDVLAPLASADDMRPLLVPVPLHWTRLWRRRYNQAALLTRALGATCGHAVELDAMARVRRTRQQVGLSGNARAENVRGAFCVRPRARPLIGGRPVVLIDDVLTTGATVAACARTLLRAGAAEVRVLTFALASSAV